MQIDNVQGLNEVILALEQKKVQQKQVLLHEFNVVVEQYKPKNILKNIFKNATDGTSVGSILLKAATTVGSAALGGKLLAGGSLLSKVAGTAINAGAVDNILEDKNKIVAWVKSIYKNIFEKK